MGSPAPRLQLDDQAHGRAALHVPLSLIFLSFIAVSVSNSYLPTGPVRPSVRLSSNVSHAPDMRAVYPVAIGVRGSGPHPALHAACRLDYGAALPRVGGPPDVRVYHPNLETGYAYCPKI